MPPAKNRTTLSPNTRVRTHQTNDKAFTDRKQTKSLRSSPMQVLSQNHQTSEVALTAYEAAIVKGSLAIMKDKCTSPLFAKMIKKNKLQMKIKKLQFKTIAYYEDREFDTIIEAKTALQDFQHALGVYRTNDTYTVRIMHDISITPIDAVKDRNWMYVRCFYQQNDGSFCNLIANVSGLTPIVHSRGCVSLTFRLKDAFYIKLHHYTCLSSGLDESQLCRACQHPEWRARCCQGRATFFITKVK